MQYTPLQTTGYCIPFSSLRFPLQICESRYSFSSPYSTLSDYHSDSVIVKPILEFQYCNLPIAFCNTIPVDNRQRILLLISDHCDEVRNFIGSAVSLHIIIGEAIPIPVAIPRSDFRIGTLKIQSVITRKIQLSDTVILTVVSETPLHRYRPAIGERHLETFSTRDLEHWIPFQLILLFLSRGRHNIIRLIVTVTTATIMSVPKTLDAKRKDHLTVHFGIHHGLSINPDTEHLEKGTDGRIVRIDNRTIAAIAVRLPTLHVNPLHDYLLTS